MQEAKHRWGFAEIHSARDQLREIEDKKPELGGPVHQQLLKRREEKLARRARREQQRIAGSNR